MTTSDTSMQKANTKAARDFQSSLKETTELAQRLIETTLKTMEDLGEGIVTIDEQEHHLNSTIDIYNANKAWDFLKTQTIYRK